MAKEAKGQGRGSNEAALMVVGSSGRVSPDLSNEVAYTPEDAEFQSYTELLGGFFEKLIRWQEILTAEEYRRWAGTSAAFAASVIQTTHGLALSDEIMPEDLKESLAYIPPLNKVLQVGWTQLGDLQPGHRHINFSILSEPAGEQLLVNPDGQPIERVGIFLCDVRDDEEDFTKFVISAPTTTRIASPYCVEYHLDRKTSTLTLTGAGFDDFLPVPSQTHLFDTIDNLIPNTTSPTPQDERRATPETPPALPHPTRRVAG